MKLILIFLVSCLVINLSFDKSFAQISAEPSTLQIQTESIINRLDTAYKKYKKKKGKENRIRARKIKEISRKFNQAIFSDLSERCFRELKMAVNLLYEYVSELNIGVSCSPNILPSPFLEDIPPPLISDCIIPDQINSLFIDLNPIYEDARELALIDNNENEIADVCEAKIKLNILIHY